MYAKPSRRKQLIRQIAVYVFMASAVIVSVTFITFSMLGYRFDTDKGIEQYAVMQYGSSPSGASVAVDGTVLGPKTPNKSLVPEGKHSVSMSRDGYDVWNKTVNVKAGMMMWLDYALLVPKKITVEPVASYDTVYQTLSSPNGNSTIVEKKSDIPTFTLVDLSSDKVESKNLTIPTTAYSGSTTVGIVHVFNIEKWDEGGRYVLVKHVYGDKNEWLVVDTQNVGLTKNITRLFDLAVGNIVFYGTSGNIFYALDSKDIRKLDLDAGTISKPLVGDVSSFELNSESKVITYIANGKTGTNQRVVGILRDGDNKPSVIRNINSALDISLHIATSDYFNQHYVAISLGEKVDILSGSYPNVNSNKPNSMKVIASFEADEDVKSLSFSPTGEYVFVQSGAYFASYDLEYQKFTASTIEGTGPTSQLKWLDHNYIWSDRDGKLTIREFDGANMHTINSVITGQDSILTSNGRYIYSIGKSKTGYQLQRVRMVLP